MKTRTRYISTAFFVNEFPDWATACQDSMGLLWRIATGHTLPAGSRQRILWAAFPLCTPFPLWATIQAGGGMQAIDLHYPQALDPRSPNRNPSARKQCSWEHQHTGSMMADNISTLAAWWLKKSAHWQHDGWEHQHIGNMMGKNINTLAAFRHCR